MIVYSQATNTFYDTQISQDIPAGSVEVTPERHAEILAELTGRGKALAADVQGMPTVIDAPTASTVELATSARKRRNQLLTESDWVVVKAVETGTPVPTQWKAYRKELRNLPEQRGFPETINWPPIPQ